MDYRSGGNRGVDGARYGVVAVVGNSAAAHRVMDASIDSWLSEAPPAGTSIVEWNTALNEVPLLDSVALADTWGVLHVPSWEGRVRGRMPLERGTGAAVLDRGSAGWYPASQGPGAVGNHALAAHRRTRGNSFLHTVDLVPGQDLVVVEHAEAWLRFVVTEQRIVPKQDNSVLAPVPGDPGAVPEQRLITLTTCGSEQGGQWGNSHRVITHGVLTGWIARGDGVPSEVAAVNGGAPSSEPLRSQDDAEYAEAPPGATADHSGQSPARHLHGRNPPQPQPVTVGVIPGSAPTYLEIRDAAFTRSPVFSLPQPEDENSKPPETSTMTLSEALAEWDSSMRGFRNGQIPREALCAVEFAPGHRLRCDAAVMLAQLNDLYRQTWGVNLRMSSSYRCIDGQIRVASATPGTSQHGWGLAVDFLGPVARFGSAEHQWLRDHAPQFGWDHPTWARSGGSKPEPWHWEFLAATPMPRVALSAAEVEVRRSG